jgi:aspartate-semialdehyde dehydrogenase
VGRKDTYVVAIVAANDMIRKELVEILEERAFPVSELVLLASDPSDIEKVQYRDKKVSVQRLANESFTNVDIVLFSDECENCTMIARQAAKSGAVVVANAGDFRDDASIPIIVPEVNPHAIEGHKGIVANPNSMSIVLSLVLKPIHSISRIKRVFITALESVSGSGKKAMDELAGQTVSLLNFRDVERKVFPHQSAFNCLPHIGAFLDDGDTQEERDITAGIPRILEDENLKITATAVLVPVFRCHSASVSIETELPLSPNEARALLAGAQGVVVFDDPMKNLYPMPIDTTGKDEVYVGRIRHDATASNILNLWVVHDNLRKGAALNAVQIAELLIR